MKERDPFSTTDALEPVYRELRDLRSEINQLKNKSIPTMPTYDSTGFPQDAVEGQLAVGANDNKLWRYVNGAWRTDSGGAATANFPWLLMLYDGTQTVTESPHPAAIQGYRIPIAPITGGEFTYDSTIFDAFVDGFGILQKGLYLATISASWYLDYGRAAIALCTDQDFLCWMLNQTFPPDDVYASFGGAEMHTPSFYPGFAGMDHQQFILENTYIFAVNDPEPIFTFNLDNLGGADRTYVLTARCTVIQLSTSSSATP